MHGKAVFLVAKRNLTIRIDDEMREKLQLIADREMRPLANQVIYFLAQGLNGYLKEHELQYDEENGTLTSPHFPF